MKIRMPPARESHYWALVLFWLLTSAVRLVYLSADAPTTLTWSGAPLTDEGRWSHNALNKALFSKWIIDDFNPIFYTPLFTLLQFISFELFGVSLASARLAGAFLGALTPLLLFCAIKEWFPRKTAWLAAVFLGANYVFLMYNRLALLETPMVFFLVAMFYFWQRGMRGGDYNFALAGLAMLAAFLVKTTALFIVPAYIVSCLWAKTSQECIAGKDSPKTDAANTASVSHRGAIGYFTAGFLGPPVLFLFCWRNLGYSALKDTHLDFFPKIPLSLLDNLQAVVTFCGSDFFAKMPVISLLTLGYLFAVFSPYRMGARLNALEVFTVSWLMAGIAILMLYRYQPSRYFLILAPPMATASAIFLTDVAGKALLIRRCRLWYALPCLALFNIGICFHLLRADNRIAIESVTESRHNFAVALLLLMTITTVALFILRSLMRRDFLISPKLTRIFAAAAVVAIIIIQGWQYLQWFHHPKYSIIEAAQQVKEMVPDDAILTGDIAPTLALENHRYTVILNSRNNLPDAEKFGITHALWWNRNNFRYQAQVYPKLFDSVEVLLELRVMDNYYRNRESGYAPESHYLYRLRKKQKKL